MQDRLEKANRAKREAISNMFMEKEYGALNDPDRSPARKKQIFYASSISNLMKDVPEHRKAQKIEEGTD